VISNSYGALNGAGLLRTVTFKMETVAMVLGWLMWGRSALSSVSCTGMRSVG
jgi:hypothetical protein